MPLRSLPCLALAVGLALVAPRPAHADDGGDRDTADALFWEGKRYEAEGRSAEACAQYEASLALSRRLGVLLNVASCQESAGKIASAWTAFDEAVSLAQSAGDPRASFAAQRRDALTPRMARLIVTVPTRTESLEVRRDGAPIPSSQYDVAVPVDVGDLRIEASAPGRVAWSATVPVRGGEVVRIVIPELPTVTVVSPRPSPPRDASPLPASTGGGRAIATWTAFGAGALGVVAGTALGGLSWSYARRGRAECDDGRCHGDAYADTLRARSLGHASTAAFAIGGVALATGLILRLTAPDEAPRVRVAPLASAHTMAVGLEGTF